MWADSDTHNPLSRHDLHQYIENTTGDIYRDGQLRLIIEDSQLSTVNCQLSTLNSQLSTVNCQLSTNIVGCIDLFDFDARNRKAAIGMYIAPEARGKGVGKQAVQWLLDYAFNFLHLRMVYAIISVNNVACSRLYEQMDFLPSSPLRAWTLEGDAILWQKMNTN
jgi:diamine N-acetyltransferase